MRRSLRDFAHFLQPDLRIARFDSVVVRGVNDDELVELVEFSRTIPGRGAVHRVHGCGRSDRVGTRSVVSQDEILAILSKIFDHLEPVLVRILLPRPDTRCRMAGRLGSFRRLLIPFVRTVTAAG